jgi:hypothetical protein
MSLNVCEEHDFVAVYTSPRCPACGILREMRNEMADLEREVEQLRSDAHHTDDTVTE